MHKYYTLEPAGHTGLKVAIGFSLSEATSNPNIASDKTAQFPPCSFHTIPSYSSPPNLLESIAGYSYTGLAYR